MDETLPPLRCAAFNCIALARPENLYCSVACRRREERRRRRRRLADKESCIHCPHCRERVAARDKAWEEEARKQLRESQERIGLLFAEYRVAVMQLVADLDYERARGAPVITEEQDTWQAV